MAIITTRYSEFWINPVSSYHSYSASYLTRETAGRMTSCNLIYQGWEGAFYNSVLSGQVLNPVSTECSPGLTVYRTPLKVVWVEYLNLLLAIDRTTIKQCLVELQRDHHLQFSSKVDHGS